MPNTANAEIRELLKVERIPYWRLANKIGCHENTIVRKLRTELNDNEKQELIKAISEIKHE